MVSFQTTFCLRRFLDRRSFHPRTFLHCSIAALNHCSIAALIAKNRIGSMTLHLALLSGIRRQRQLDRRKPRESSQRPRWHAY
jgi:hypothetical protein